jgi:hypothetical protein
MLTPEAVTRKVIKAGSRWASSRIATDKALAMVPNRAIPAMACTSTGGNARNSAPTEAPNAPSNK